MVEIIQNLINRFLTWKIEKECCPTINEINELDNLAIRLKENKLENTISNILEWQDKNIEYWYERSELFLLVYFCFLILACIISALLLPYFTLPLFILFLIPVFLYLRHADYLSLMGYFLSFPIIIILLVIAIPSKNISDNFLILLLLITFLLGIIFGNYIFAFFKYQHFLHKNSDENNMKILMNLFSATFNMSLPITDILNYKIAICRDYAKITIGILLKLNIDAYLITIPHHVAGAVKINNEYYIIDQSMPIKKIDKWMIEQKAKKVDIFKVSNDDVKVKTEYLGRYDTKKFEKNNDVDITKIQNDIDVYFPSKVGVNKNLIKIIRLNNASFFYDEVTHFSIVRKIKNIIEDEFCDNTNRISKVEIEQTGSDLSVNIY